MLEQECTHRITEVIKPKAHIMWREHQHIARINFYPVMPLRYMYNLIC